MNQRSPSRLGKAETTASSMRDTAGPLQGARNGEQEAWHSLDAARVAAALEVDPTSGLGDAEARVRLEENGANRLRKEAAESIWETFQEELREPMILLLLATGALYAIWGELPDALTIFFVIFVLVAVEVVNERRAKSAISALSKLAEPTTQLRRDGRVQESPADELVPGDVALLQAGRRVAADARLLDAPGLAVDESPLTGESAPVDKQAAETLPQNTALAERTNMVYAGTTVVRGHGSAIVVATGMATELGRVAGLARSVRPPRTMLQEAMRQLSGYLVWAAIGFSILVPVLGVVIAGQPVRQMLLTGLSLAFSVIPEELPIIITMVLGLGAYRLARQHAIVKRLQAVETLGAITVIATDKTGTLTENRMRVSELYPERSAREILEIGVLCNDAVDGPDGTHGDPLDIAMLHAAREAGIDVEALRHRWPVRDEFTFDNTRKRMSVVYERDDGLLVLVKGAPEVLLANSNRIRSDGEERELYEADRRPLLARTDEMAGAGLRVVALAKKTTARGVLTQDRAESGLTFIGLAGFVDPPRPEVKQAIADCRAAGIRPIMITGDHPLTARDIARQVGLAEDGRLATGRELDEQSDAELRDTVADVSIYARTNPEHKLRIVRALQDRGERVAVTGDGINDAPALAAADIGVAMGETGTDVAREAASIVLADDNFATIVRAVREGRVLFDNLTKGVRYYLACKVALVAAALLPVLLGVPVPFAPVQIILMELFMDLAASATFVVEPAEAGLMQRPPRDPKAPFMGRAMVTSIFVSAAGLFTAVSVTYLITWYGSHDLTRAQTMAFVTWLLGHVLLALNMRSERESLIRHGVLSNRLMLWWGAATIMVVVVMTSVPSVGALFRVARLDSREWALAITAALAGTFWLEIVKFFARRREPHYPLAPVGSSAS